MLSQLSPAIRMTLLMTLLTGLIYPLAVTGVTQVLFPRQANGSLLEKDGKIVGSELLGQAFTRPEYFHSRPSAAGNGYDGTASTGSNYGPTSAKLLDRVKTDLAKVRQENQDYKGPIPADMVTASGSGLDPHISPAAAAVQVARVAKVRGMAIDRVRGLVAANTENRTLGFIGEPRVNVLELNLALDRQSNGR